MEQAQLVRLVVAGGNVIVDETGSAPGRGAYLHPRGECLEIALRRKALGRALRSNAATGGLAAWSGWCSSPATR